VDSHEEVTLKLGDFLLVRLEVPGTSGYLWRATEYGDEVQVVEEPRSKDEVRQLPIGESTGQTFRITAVAPGETTVIFTLARPWESDQFINRHFVSVRVQA
jgi:predicted secreted protein